MDGGTSEPYADETATTSGAKAPFSLPVAFEPNMGQADLSIQLIGRGRGLSVYLTRRGIDLQVPSPSLPGAHPRCARK